MKTFLKFAGIISVVLAVVAFILMMATPVAKYSGSYTTLTVEGTSAIFGTKDYKLAWSALLAWIFVLVALIILIAGIVLPLLKVKALDKFAGVLNLVAVVCLVVAGIFMFCSKAALGQANLVYNVDPFKDFALGAGWVIGGILAIVAGAVAIAPAAADFLKK